MRRLAVLASIVFILAIGSIANAATPVGLGAADSFVVLAGAPGITNTGPTTLNGDIGHYPGPLAITGTASMTITGTNHGIDAVSQQAQTDLVTAYNNAAGQGPTSPVAADLGGQTLVPGVYNSASSLGLTGELTLDGGGNRNAVFVFQAGSTLTTASGSRVTLINGAQSCNVFWQVGSSATLGTGSNFVGTIMALTSINLLTGANMTGRALARNGAVTLDTNSITKSTCFVAPPPPAPATASPAPTATPSTPTATPSTPTTTPTGATATPARVTVLPSTSTSADLPLGAISVMLIAIGGALLLIRRTRTSTD